MDDSLGSANGVSYSEAVQFYRPTGFLGFLGNIGIYAQKATLEVHDGTVVVMSRGQTVFDSPISGLQVTASPLPTELTNGTLLLQNGQQTIKVKFFEYSHPFKSRSWHNRMMYQKHDGFTQVLSQLSVPNLPSPLMPEN